jgi:uncharacterized protein HemY
MLILIFTLLLAAALFSLLAMQGAIVWSALAAAIALVLLLANLLAGRRLPRRPVRMISAAGLAIILLIGLWSGLQPKAGGFLAYDAEIARVESLLAKGKVDQAQQVLDQLITVYGPNDRLRLFKAQASLDEADYAGADASLNEVAGKSADEYYALRGQAYALSGQNSEAERILIQAASQYPLWCEMQLYAGIQAVNNKAYATGEYFLLRAIEQDPELSVALYYLGVIRYEQGLYSEASGYFTEALTIGVDENIASYISWYDQQMGGETP